MESALTAFESLLEALQYPLDDPNQTLIAVLVLVVAGLLVAVILIALASPSRHAHSDSSDESVIEPTENTTTEQ